MALQALKQSVARRLIGDRKHFWQARYYDFNVYTKKKRVEKLRYMHRNPVKRGLVEEAARLALEQFSSLPDGRRRRGGDRVGVDGKEAGTEGMRAAGEAGHESRQLWYLRGKAPPEQTKLGWGTHGMVGWATRRDHSFEPRE